MWLLAAVAMGLILVRPWAPAAQEQEQPKKVEEQSQQPKAPEAPVGQEQGKPKKLNPYTKSSIDHEVLPEGRTIWMQTGCPGCHGMGGGGMCPSVMDDQWKFGGDDETLFKVIKGMYPGQTMPAVFGQMLNDDQVWKIIAWIRSIYKGDPDKIVW